MHISHNEIGIPNFKIQSDSKNLAILTIEPLPEGFGTTIGNSMRRVLLSSLPGTAAVAVKIDGVSHEYSTIPGVKDSVLDIILNIRELRLRKHSKGEEIVEVAFKKSGTITAADLKVSSDIEILDPTQIITQCDDADPKKKIYLKITKGVGYKLISNQQNAENKEVDFILIDANFSPIKNVKYEIKSARVGEITNLDKLILEVETNGSMEAESAIKFAANILQNYFSLFNKEDAYTDEDFISNFEKIKQQREKKIEKKISTNTEEVLTPIDILGLSQRTSNALINNGITTVEKLVKMSMAKLSKFRGFGSKARTELLQILEERGYSLQEEN